MLFLVQHRDSPRKCCLVVHFDRLKSHATIRGSGDPVECIDTRGLQAKTTDPQKASGYECNMQEMQVDEDSEPEPLEN